MMTVRPLNLYPHEVRAIQAGRQTQLRRPVKPQPDQPLQPYQDVLSGETVWVHPTGRSEEKGVLEYRDGSTRPLSTLLVKSYRCPFGAPGDRLWCRERMWISECGGYYAYDARSGSNEVMRDVVSADGSQLWRAPRYRPTGFDDPDPRFQYFEFPHLVTSWINQGRSLRGGSLRPFPTSSTTRICARRPALRTTGRR